MMDKKGFLFTVFMLLFLSTFVISTLAYVHWYNQFSSDSTTLLSSARSLDYIFDDLTSDILVLQGFERVTINHTFANVTVSFQGGFNSSVDYPTLLQSYSQFLQGNYSSALQYPLSVGSLSYGFTVPLYGTSTEKNSSNFYVYTQNSTLLKQVNVTLIVSNTTALNASASPSAGSSGTFVHVRMIDRSGRELLNTERLLSPSAANSAFQVNFTSSSVSVYFQRYNGRDGTLWFDYDPNVTLMSLDLVYSEMNRTLIVGTNTSITVRGSGISQTKTLGIEG